MYFVAHLIVLLVPGFCLVSLFGIRQQPVGIALGLSYLVVIVLVASARYFQMQLATVVALWVLLVLALLVATGFSLRRRTPDRTLLGDQSRNSLVITVALGTIGAGLIWILGPYLEVPADVFRHLDNIQRIFVDLDDGQFSSQLDAGLAYRVRGEFWFYLHCILTIVSGTSQSSALLQASMANTAIVVMALFGFSQIVFKELDRRQCLAAALISTVLFVLFFGINVFAWVRYYALAPAYLALPIYFVVMGMLASVDTERGLRLNWLLLAAVLTVTAGLIHRQEALFIYVIGSVFVLVLAWRHRPGSRFAKASISPGIDTMNHPGRLVIPWWVLAAMTVVLGVVVVVWSHVALNKNPVVDGEVLELRKHLPTVRDIHILDPSWKFYRTIGAFGVLVYIGFVVWWTHARRHLLLVVAMVAPLAHVFNPVFADVFLRHSSADTFWRMSYTVPITFLGALFVLIAWRNLFDGQRMLWGRITGGAFLLAALLTLGPSTIAGYPTWTRWQTLQPVPAANSLKHYADLVEVFRSLDLPNRVHTDPVTAYVLLATTQADAHRTKFYRPRVSELDPGYYSKARLAELDGHIVVTNLRDGAPSETGQRSGHWPAVITATSAYYSREFLEFVKAQPDVFRPLWTDNKISLYRIHD